ncbi:hypothetical protein [Rhizobium deserti]|uniref:hypothetical protein n=1 Tax=Rhizobium deserti TaxID=2547961 RepID=UPI00192A2141|nr:hypothetical protein [Rhizobium deserti]
MTNSVTHDEAVIENMRASVIRKAIGPTILLGSGTYFDFEDPESSEITIEDIAYGLAFEGRCAGQCYSRLLQRRVFYSVAQHCVLMSLMVPPELQLQALMHEAGEAVCGDMTAPLKSLNPSFKAIEKRCEAAILQRFGITMTDLVALKHHDIRMLATERRDLLLWRGEKWSLTDIEPYDFHITPWTPEQAAEAFLARYAELTSTPAVEPTAANSASSAEGEKHHARESDKYRPCPSVDESQNSGIGTVGTRHVVTDVLKRGGGEENQANHAEQPLSHCSHIATSTAHIMPLAAPESNKAAPPPQTRELGV